MYLYIVILAALYKHAILVNNTVYLAILVKQLMKEKQQFT